MAKKDRVKEAWKLFNSTIKKGVEIYSVETKDLPRLYELRELASNLPTSIYFALVEEIKVNENRRIFKAIVLSEEVLLSYLSKKTPVIKLPRYRTILLALPAWVYLDADFLANYTYRRGVLRNGSSEKLIRYAETTPIPQGVKGKFINSIMKILAPYNTATICGALDAIEEETTVIRIPDEIRRYFEEKYGKE
jgi:hypothetical protein